MTQRPPGQPGETPDAAVPNRDRVAEPVANATPSGSADHRQALQAVSAATAQMSAQPSSEQAAASLVGDLAAGQPGPTGSTPATGVTATHDQATASPMQQIAPALLSVTHTQTGTSQMTLRLNPPELGLVQVQIDRSANTASVTVIAERSDTLQMLQQDQPALQRALDQAGVPADGRTISFHVGELSGPAASGGNQGPGSNSGNPSGTADGNTMAHSQGGNSGGGAGYTAREQGGYASNRRSAASSSAADAQPADTVAPRWLRVGLDITA